MILADPALREELAICHHYRIGHSAFLRWSAADQDKAKAFHRYEQSVCKGCGTRADEWNPAAGGDRHAYVAATEDCPGCQVRGDLEQEQRESATQKSGMRIVLLPRAVAEAREAERLARRRAREAAMA